MYCYKFTGESSTVKNRDGHEVTALHTKSCPYSKVKVIRGVRVPYCSYLRMKGISNNWKSKDWKKLIDKYGENEVYSWLDLLWDGVKCCGENYGFDDE